MLARLFVIIGGLIVLALTAALVVPYFVDWTGYRADFEREASAILGRKVTVQGSATARLLPFPSVTFSDVAVGGGNGGEPAMTVENFSMDAELAPFMRGELLIFDMRIVRPRAIIDVAEDGTVDWAVRPSTPFDPRRIALEKLTVTDGQITIRHAAGGRDHVLSGINTEISAKSLAGPWRANGSLLIDGIRSVLAASTGTTDENGQMRLRVKVDPETYPLVIEADGNARIENGAALYAGQFKIVGNEKPAETLRGGDGGTVKAGASKAEPGNRMNGEFSLDHKRLSLDSFRFETGPLDNPYTADGTAFIELGETPRFSIEAKGAQVRFDEAIAGSETSAGLTLASRISALEKALAGLPRPTIPGSVEVDLPAVVAGDTTVRDVRLSAEPAEGGWTVKSLAATLPGRTTLEADGFLRTDNDFGFAGSLLLAVAQPSGFAAWVSSDVDEAIRRLPAAGFKASVDMTEQRQTFKDLELILGKAKFSGEIDSRQPPDVRPSVLLKLDGEAMDVDGLSAFASLFVSDKGANRFADRDLDFQIKAGPVSAGGLTADTIDTALRLRSGLLEIDRLSVGGLAGASLSATGTIKDFPQSPTGKLDASVVAVDLAPLVKLAAERYPDNAFLKGLNERAIAYPDLLQDAQIDMLANAAAGDGGTTEISLSAKGNAGGSALSAALSGKGKADALAEVPLELTFSARNDDATTLLALIGLPTLPLGVAGQGDLALSAKGNAANGLETAFTLTGDGFSAKFDGMTGPGEQGPTAKGRISLEATDIEPWLMTTAVHLPGLGMGTPLALAADGDYENGLLVLDNLDGTINEGAVSGGINVEIKDGLPHLTGALALDEMSLDPAVAMVLGEQAAAPVETGWSSVPFQPKVTAPFAADLEISAATVSIGSTTSAYDASIALKLDGEGLRLSDIKAKLFGGAFSGLFELKNDGGSGLFSGQAKLEGADLAMALTGAGLNGKGDFSTALTASGKSVGGLVAGLSGSGTATVNGLVIPGVNPNALATLLARADAVGRDIDAARTAGFTPAIVGAGTLPAGNADIAFTVAGGILRAPPVSFATPAVTLTSDMRADLNTDTIAADGTISYAPGDEALVGSEPSLRFHLSGSPAALRRTLDSDPLAQFLTQRALEREQARVEAMQAEVLEKQRLRREVRYYAALQQERERAAEALRLKQEEEARAKAEEEARLAAEAKAREEAAAAAKALEDAAAKARADAEAKRAADEAAQKLEQAARESAREAARAADAEKARQEAERKAQQPAPEIQRAPLPPASSGGSTGSTQDFEQSIRDFLNSLDKPQ